MKNFRTQPLFAVVLLMMSALTTAYAQITPSDDSYTSTATPTTNFGAKTTLGVVSPSQSAYIQFDLSSIPAGYTSASIAKATLKLYVNTVPSAGSFNVDFVNGTWSEKTITANLAPALGSTIAPSVPLTGANAKDYLLIDVTAAVGAWLNGTQANDGIALVANSPLSATFDSKENTAQSHPPELDIVFSGGGTITGITTASGSGLIGGTNKGVANLSLLTSCSSGQILSWNGTAWACKSVSGSGTVTSVGLSAPASDFTVSGSPVTTSGTLGLNWKVSPSSASAANAIVKRDANGDFWVNAITGTGTFVTETTNPYGMFALSTSPTGIGSYGEANSATGLTIGVKGVTDSLGTGGAAGVFGVASSADPSAGPSQGVAGQSNSSRGIGVIGFGSSLSATLSRLIGVVPVGVWGDSAGGFAGVFATNDSGTALQATNNSPGAPTMEVVNDTTAPSGHVFTTLGTTNFCDIDVLGNLHCSGTLSGAAKNFKIDHPLDPANKYLVHASIESPDMKTVYDGVTVLDADGQAWVKLPAYVEALNGEFRYQLTCMGSFAPVYVAQEISNNRFRIAGGTGGMKVSWQVTGTRHDAYAKAHPLVVESEKQGDERGHYLHPEEFGQPNELGITAVHRAKMRPRPADQDHSSAVAK
ncbi:MAG: DNRLRE domain-containing protein [Acidobacteria bacterium]|nr:DNRLRE domain-containing protein [Acidobacteriota bacterium]